MGEHAIWGKHALFEESLRSPLIIRYEGLPRPGEASESIVETLDLYPTLCDLAGLPVPSFVAGTTLRPILENPRAAGHSAISYTRRAQSIRTDRYRLIVHGDGHAELYDHQSDQGETVNLANDRTDVVERLRGQLNTRL